MNSACLLHCRTCNKKQASFLHLGSFLSLDLLPACYFCLFHVIISKNSFNSSSLGLTCSRRIHCTHTVPTTSLTSEGYLTSYLGCARYRSPLLRFHLLTNSCLNCLQNYPYATQVFEPLGNSFD